MSGRNITKGSVDQSTVIRIIDATDGTPETGVIAATTGLSLAYRREGAVMITLTAANNLATLATAHTDGGILHIGAGYYRVDPQDAAYATGADGVLIFGVCTGMVVIGTYHPLVDLNLSSQSAIDLKDFADDGYDPATKKVKGVELVDNLTTVATGGITASSIATDAIGAVELAADAVTEIQSGLATAANLATLTAYVDTEIAAILAAVDTEIAAIKAKTDSLTFTTTNLVDANVQQINDVTLTGDGSGTPFGV